MFFVYAIDYEFGQRHLRRDYRTKSRARAVNRCIKKKGYVQEYPSGRVVFQNLVSGLNL